MISRRTALKSFVAGTAGVLRGATRRAGDKPNLLFLWTDQQRADTMVAYGNTAFRMPALNRLASSSIVFGRCYDTQPVCTPARSTVMTGQWPHATGLVHNNIALPANVPVMPQLLNDAAYRTGYMGKWHLGDEVFAQRGFEQWVSIEDYMYSDYFSPGRDPKARSSYHHFLSKLGYKPDRKDGTYSRTFSTNLPVEHCKPAFLAWHASDFVLKNRAEPWMLYVNFLEPHTPHNGPWNNLHSAEEAPLAANYPGAPVEREPEAYRKRRKKEAVGREEMQQLRRNYAGLCSQVDQAVGRILWALEASGQAENTIIVFTSDHGEMGGSHGLTAKGVMYEEAVRIPMLLRVPWRQSRAIHVKQPVSHIDVVPTLLEAMGARNPGNLPGESLLPLAEGKVRAEGNVIIEWDSPVTRAVVSPDGWKMALLEKDNCLLFDRNRDALEQNNVFYRSEAAPVVRRLRAALEKWQQRTGDKAQFA